MSVSLSHSFLSLLSDFQTNLSKVYTRQSYSFLYPFKNFKQVLTKDVKPVMPNLPQHNTTLKNTEYLFSYPL